MNNLMKKTLCLLVGGLMIASFAACGGGNSSSTAPQADQPGGSSASPAIPAGEKVVIKLGHGQPIESEANKSLELMAEKVLEESGGTLEIQIFPANQLGNERDLAEGLGQGTVDMSWISTAVLENFETKLALFSLPYVFENYDHVAAVVNSEVGDDVFDALLSSHGIRTMGFFNQGFRWVWNNDKPIHTLDDIQGMKLRAPESPVYMGTFQLLGANPTPMPWGELYTALQTNVVAGYEVFPESTISNKMYEVCKYGSKTNHIYAGSILMIRDDLYQSLSDEHKEILDAAAKEAEEYNNNLIIENEELYIQEAVANGMEINNIPAGEIAKFATAVEPLYEDYAEALGGLEIIEKAKNTTY